uniref:COPIIcoated_ERV domain-containing protein n=1 Tax=Caenorhabditis tropicalis TaxID=1561998 RepID=A0A1I7T1S3_9PELO
MDLGTSEIRQRKGITKIVEDFDIFEKVVENVKEEKKASSGAISFVCFTIIFCLFCTETYTFLFHKKYDYRFAVDTEMDEMPLLDLDMVVNTACSTMQVASSSDEYAGGDGLLRQTIQKIRQDSSSLTRNKCIGQSFVMHTTNIIEEEFEHLKRSLEYVDDDIETNLETLANEKQEEEAAHIKEERKKNKKMDHRGTGQIMFLVSNGMGMFQLVADNGGGDGEEGKACRLHGKFRVRKGKEEKIVMSISNPLMMFNHDTQAGNISHRIEKFNFGPRIPGLVTPLAGAEHISESGQDIYRYFIKIVPTKIYGYFTYTMAYQYSVTFLKKQLKEGEHSHGGILFEYEFNANVIEVHKTSVTLFSYLIRICSILGGVYATSTIVNNIVQFILSLFYPEKTQMGQFQQLRDSNTNLSSTSHAAFTMDANMRVH